LADNGEVGRGRKELLGKVAGGVEELREVQGKGNEERKEGGRRDSVGMTRSGERERERERERGGRREKRRYLYPILREESTE
jgi:hypothetical protein